MQSVLYIDIETRSRVDLKKTSVYRYVNDDDFLILMAAWSLDNSPVRIALSADEIAAIPGLWDPDVIKVAHNAQFERVCFSRFRAKRYNRPSTEFLPPHEWRDTMAIAAEHGLPRSLEMLGRALGGEQKDKSGTDLVRLFCRPNRSGGWNGPHTHPEKWMDFIAYCEQDVVTLLDIDSRLGDLGHWPTPTEQAVFHADQTVNDRGIAIDVNLAAAAVQAGDLNQAEQRARVTEISGIENPGSVQQVTRWLAEQGVNVPNLRAETVEGLLEGDELQPAVREVLELRQELALVASKKFASALYGMGPDGRLRGTLAFFGAHTGRWAGRGTQLQNLPRQAFSNVVDTELCIADLLAGERVEAEDLKRLVRPMFTGPFTVVDYSAIEARVVAWLAGEQWALDAFEAGRDIYIETADRMSTPSHPLDRSQGKVAVLALGYNGGTNSLRAMGAEGDERQLKNLVTQWRRANPHIVRLWQLLGDAFSDVGDAGPLLRTTETEEYGMGRTVRLWLPSGRAITYHDVRWERYKLPDPVTGKLVSKEGWRFADPKNPFNHRQRIGTYGGRLCENATQAVARDILAEALVRLERLGYRVVAHVHDEILVEGEHDVDEIKAVMVEPPSWAAGLPIDGEGFTTQRYRKG